MAFVDELKIHIKAGKGGDGVVRWLHEKSREFMGPAGGNGGRGGDVYVCGVSDLSRLSEYRHKKEFKAESGVDGGSRSMHGKDGEDLTIDVPIGTIVTRLSDDKNFDIKEVGEKVMILKGGRGGYGNEHFKGSKNIQPQEFTLGKPGEESEFKVELQIIASASLVGLPNAGKSSLLNAITNAEAKVGNYEFTTLEPNLGALFGFILADVPGLIQGASDGRGLGHKFLRHIKRTKIILHCVSLENENLLEAYETIRKELQDFDPEVAAKPEYIIFTKSDALPEDVVKEKVENFLILIEKPYFLLSVYDETSTKAFSDELIKILS